MVEENDCAQYWMSLWRKRWHYGSIGLNRMANGGIMQY